MDGNVISMNREIWIFAILLVGWCIIQAAAFLMLALKFAHKYHTLTKKEMDTCVKTGIISTIGPTINTVLFAVFLISMVGTATTFMRLGVIGSPMMEFNMAQNAAALREIRLGTGNISKEDFTFILFGLQVACIPFLIVTMVFLRPLDAALVKSKKRKEDSFLPLAMNGMGIGVLAYTCTMYLTGAAQVIALVAAFSLSAIIDKIAKSRNITWLFSYNFLLSMIFGMACGQIAANIS